MTRATAPISLNTTAEPRSWRARVAPQRAAHRRAVLKRLAAARDVARPLPLVRLDTLDTIPHDTGCRLAPLCRACPLPACVHDQPSTPRTTPTAQQRKAAAAAERRRHRDRQLAVRHTNIATAYALGARAPDLAAAFRIDKRTIYRDLTPRQRQHAP